MRAGVVDDQRLGRIEEVVEVLRLEDFPGEGLVLDLVPAEVLLGLGWRWTQEAPRAARWPPPSACEVGSCKVPAERSAAKSLSEIQAGGPLGVFPSHGGARDVPHQARRISPKAAQVPTRRLPGAATTKITNTTEGLCDPPFRQDADGFALASVKRSVILHLGDFFVDTSRRPTPGRAGSAVAEIGRQRRKHEIGRRGRPRRGSRFTVKKREAEVRLPSSSGLAALECQALRSRHWLKFGLPFCSPVVTGRFTSAP